MTQTWTEKHLHFCITKRLTPTAIKLYQWLVGEMREGYAEIIDLHDFQRLVTQKRGKAHDFRTIQAAVERLTDAGILSSARRKFTNFVWRFTLRPINRLIYSVIPKPKKSESRSQIPNLQASNTLDAVEEEITATTDLNLINQMPEKVISEIETNLDLCEEAGIFYTPRDIPKILIEDPEDVKAAIAYYKEYSSRKIVTNPPGFLRDCLQFRWWEKKSPPSFSDVILFLAKHFGLGASHE